MGFLFVLARYHPYLFIFFSFSNIGFHRLTVNFLSGEVLSTKSAAAELTTKSVREGKLDSVSACGTIVRDSSIQ